MAEAFGAGVFPRRLAPARLASPPGLRAALSGAEPAQPRNHRSVSSRRAAVHARASRAGARLGAQAGALAVGGAGPLHHLGMAGGRSRRETAARRHPARSRRLSRLQRNAAGAVAHRHACAHRRSGPAPELVRPVPLLRNAHLWRRPGLLRRLHPGPSVSRCWDTAVMLPSP